MQGKVATPPIRPPKPHPLAGVPAASALEAGYSRNTYCTSIQFRVGRNGASRPGIYQIRASMDIARLSRAVPATTACRAQRSAGFQNQSGAVILNRISKRGTYMDPFESFKSAQKQSWSHFTPFEAITTPCAAQLVKRAG